MKIRNLLSLIALIPALVMAQSAGTISGPTLGYVFDPSLSSIRPLRGIAGSAMVGEPVNLGFALSNAISLRDERYILAAPQEGSYLVAINLGVNPPVAKAITGAAKSAAITLSPNGKTAALSLSQGRLIEVITGLPENPSITLEITTSFLFANPPHRVAVSDDSTVLLMSFIEDGRENIYRWNGTEGFRFLASTEQVGAMMFIGSSDALYVDSGSNEVFRARDIKRMSITQFVAGPRDGVSRPVGIGISGNGGYYIANAGSDSVMSFDDSGHLLQTQNCECDISGLYLLGARTYRLTEGLNQTIHILDDNSAESRILFVPPIQSPDATP